VSQGCFFCIKAFVFDPMGWVGVILVQEPTTTTTTTTTTTLTCRVIAVEHTG
jgi:hypothetical protein